MVRSAGRHGPEVDTDVIASPAALAVPPRMGAIVARDVFALVVSSYVGQFLVLALAFALRKQLGPQGMGYIMVAQLAATYAPYVGLGAFQVAEREIAVENGRGRPEVARSIENGASVASFAFSLVVALAGTLVGADNLWHGQTTAGILALVVAATLISQQFAIRATVVLRTQFRFAALGWSMAATAVAMIGLTLTGAVLAGTHGALAGAVAGSVAQGAILTAVARPARWHRAEAKVLARIYRLAPGFLALGLATVALGTIDQLAVGALLGPTALGLYSAAYLGNGFALRIPTMISAAIYPRMQRQLGRSSDPLSVYRLAERTSVVLAIVVPAAVAVFAFAVPLGIQVLLPEFLGAVTSSRLLLVGILGLALSMPAAQFLITTDRQWLVVRITVATVIAMGTAYAALAALGRLDVTLAAAVDAATYLAFAAAMHIAASRAAQRAIGTALLVVLIDTALAVAISGIGLVVDGAFAVSSGGHFVAAAAGLGSSLVIWAIGSGWLMRALPEAKADVRLLRMTAVGWFRRGIPAGGRHSPEND